MDSKSISAQFTDVSPRTAAFVAGLGLLVMAILAAFANFYVLQKLVVAGDANATAANIVGSVGLFGIGLSCLVLVAALDVVVAWALYVLLEPVSSSLSLLTAWFRVTYAAVFAVALIPLSGIQHLLGGSEYLQGFETNQLHTQVMLSVNAFRSGWDIGLILFGLHLLGLGYLVYRSGFFPKWLGVLVGIASLGYLVDSFGKILIPNYTLTLSMFTFVGEFLLIFWLLGMSIRGLSERPRAQPQRA